MSSEADAAHLVVYKSPKSVIARFVARRTMKSATLWAFIFGAYVASKAEGFIKAYPTPAEKAAVTHSLAQNVGLNALVGTPHHVENVPGFVAWNALMVLTIIGSIWALTLATKYFRGEEDAGRSEILLSGQTTQTWAAVNILVGLSSSLLVLYAVVAAIFVLLGRSPSIGFTVSSSLFFALACTCGAAMFLAVGAFTSQLMATRTRASAAAAAVFGASFLIRATADTARLHWLLAVSPIGWIEKLQPLTGSQPLWLLPIFGFTALLTGLTVWLASRRDLGDSVIADTDSARPHTALLNSPFWAGLRLTRASVAGWLLAIAFLGTFYGILTKAAVQAFNTAGNAAKVFNRIEHTAQHSLGTLYLGFVFFILMPIIMSLVASAVGHIRKDEAEGFVDNFLVRPVSRQRWLAGRLALVGLTAVLACLLSSLCIWAGQASQHAGVSFHDLLLAGLNMIAPVLFAFGFAMLAFGFVPRYTTLAIYGLIGWSFLISMVSSGLNLSHWLLDTSLLHQVALAPAVSPAWKTNAVMAALGLLLCAIGMWRFNSRDLQSE